MKKTLIAICLLVIFGVVLSLPTSSLATLSGVNWEVPTAGDDGVTYKSGSFERWSTDPSFGGPLLADSGRQEIFQAVFKTLAGENLYFNAENKVALESLTNSTCFLVTRRNSLVDKILGWLGNTKKPGVSKYTPVPEDFCK